MTAPRAQSGQAAGLTFRDVEIHAIVGDTVEIENTRCYNML